MPSNVLFDGALSGSFVASRPFLLSGTKLVLDFEADVSQDDTKIEWYLEFASEDPNSASTKFYREVSEELVGDGTVKMAEVVRFLTENGNDDGLDTGVHNLSMQFVRDHQFVRINIRAASGAASVRVSTPFGLPAVSPS